MIGNSGTLKGLRTNNNTEEWHSKLRKLAGKAHSIYKAVTLFQSEHAVIEISLMQLAAGRLPKRRIRKYRNHGKRLTTINYEAGDYTLSELLKAHSHWVEYLQVTKSFLNENKHM